MSHAQEMLRAKQLLRNKFQLRQLAVATLSLDVHVNQQDQSVLLSYRHL
jgi:hypothetical protein